MQGLLAGSKHVARWLVLSLRIVLVMLILAACGKLGSDGDDKDASNGKMVTVGVLSFAAVFEPVVEGFKAGMAERGYVEGENVTYVYDGPAADMQGLEADLQDMLSKHKFDLFLTAGTPATTLAKAQLEEKNIPIVFAPVNDPVGSGLVASLTSPGANLTGIRAPDSTGKALEWLVKIVPGVKRVFVPHNPNDNSSVQSVNSLQTAAAELGVELVIQEVSTPEEIAAVSTHFPEDVDAVFLPRAGSLTNRISDFVQTADAQGIPVVYAEIGQIVEDGVMISYGASYYDMGKQASGLAVQILEGTAAADLPVQVAESYLGINLKTAAVIGVEIPDSMVRLATQVVRADQGQ
jgi:putative ABC transport system substrate-binding protein